MDQMPSGKSHFSHLQHVRNVVNMACFLEHLFGQGLLNEVVGPIKQCFGEFWSIIQCATKLQRWSV